MALAELPPALNGVVPALRLPDRDCGRRAAWRGQLERRARRPANDPECVSRRH